MTSLPIIMQVHVTKMLVLLLPMVIFYINLCFIFVHVIVRKMLIVENMRVLVIMTTVMHHLCAMAM